MLKVIPLVMKVKSVLFSEMRNKLGDQIIGTGWKGRMVFRAYKKPANPKSCSQTANRDHQDLVLKLYQSNAKGDADMEAEWDVDALPRRISGYNLFMKLGRSSRIDSDDMIAEGDPIAGHYTVKSDISTAGLYRENLDDNVFTEIVAVGDMVAGDDVVFADTMPNPCVLGVVFYIVDGRSKTIPPVNADRASLVNSWSLDEVTNCEAVKAFTSVTP